MEYPDYAVKCRDRRQTSLAEERERRHIPADLHDNAYQGLALSKMKLQAVPDDALPVADHTLRQVCDGLNQTIDTVRELLINVIKHARAGEVRLDIRREDDSIGVTVTDDGVGFDVDGIASSASRSRRVGLFNVQERLDYIGGRLEMDSHPGHGSRFTLIAPLETKVHVAKESHDGSEDSAR